MSIKSCRTKEKFRYEINGNISYYNCKNNTNFELLSKAEVNNPRKYFDNKVMNLYICKDTGKKFLEKPSNYNKEKFRTTKAADKRVKFIQRNILRDMKKMDLPRYINSLSFEKEGRSFFTNGKIHKRSDKFIIMDIEKFFDNCTYEYVFKMCHTRGKYGLDVSQDVAYFISNFVTGYSYSKKERVLIQGFPTSPIIAFYAYIQMFEEIFEYSKKNNVTFTCYVDDLAFSYDSDNSLNEDLFEQEIINIVKRYKHNINTGKTKKGSVATITGVYVKKNTAIASQRIHKKFNSSYKKCISNPIRSKEELYKLWNDFNKFRGLYYTILYIEPKNFLLVG